MSDLADYLEELHKLDEVRSQAKDFRERALFSLRRIEDVERDVIISEKFSTEKVHNDFVSNWICSGNNVEVALLVQAQNHRNYSQYEKNNEEASASQSLTDRLKKINLSSLLPYASEDDLDTTVPVLLAARALQALAARSETALSQASISCYYRIVRELYYADIPDWTIGAGRAGRGGRTSAFITNECIRAISIFESAVDNTAVYFRHTRDLYAKFLQLSGMLKDIGVSLDSEHPLRYWADKTIERMWLDWYISVNPRNGAIVLHCSEGIASDIFPFSPRIAESVPEINMQSIEDAFSKLGEVITSAMRETSRNIENALEDIKNYRKKESESIDSDRTESAHRIAYAVIFKVSQNALRILDRGFPTGFSLASDSGRLLELLAYLYSEYRAFPEEIHRVLEPAKRYARTVLDRELAIAHSGKDPDAGELIFAATAFGTATNWQEDEKLIQACRFLIKSISDSGRFATARPFQADRRGYKLLPIGCEMIRSFAKLLHRTSFDFDAILAKKMINIFLNDKQLVQSRFEDGHERCAGWSFENAPTSNKPYVWVTAIAVQALDRIVRMLNGRINEMIFKHFKVVKPLTSHGRLTLNDLVYPDYGLRSELDEERVMNKKSIAIRLEQMRAHVMRAPLPKRYKIDSEGATEKVFSAILYGPPGTGKTSLLEALALSSRVPLVMLSPSDLVVQGQEHLEGRAKAVFDALSMLSQAVILLDEFEPVLHSRLARQKAASDRDNHEEASGEDRTSMLSFLLTGMLPKLVGLHDAAENQSLVYCLATNHLEKIDLAAKRRGRFDVRQPIFNPDPISRAGELLFRMHSIANGAKVLDKEEKMFIFAGIVAATANESAGEISRKFFKPDKLKAYFGEHDADAELASRMEKDAIYNFRSLNDALERVRDFLDHEEKGEREHLFDSEKAVHERYKRRGQGGKKKEPAAFIQWFLSS